MNRTQVCALPGGLLEKYNRFERARILGARALQIAMGAPIVIDVPAEVLHDPVRVAELEFRADAVPITVLRPEGGHRPPRVRKEIVTGRALKRESMRAA
jgi:DNA-directed RNA polymerase subunit K